VDNYNIILADDHVMFRKGVKKILEEDGCVSIVGEVGDGLSLLNLLKMTLPDMVILDISMPKMDGVAATREIKSKFPKVKVLLLTMHNDEEYLRQGLEAGADGYLLKNDADTELFVAIDEIQHDKPYISPTLSKDLAKHFVYSCRKNVNKSSAIALSMREREILRLIAEGKTSKEIAKELFISHRTVDNHRKHIMEKLNLRNIASLVRYAILKGYT